MSIESSTTGIREYPDSKKSSAMFSTLALRGMHMIFTRGVIISPAVTSLKVIALVIRVESS